MTTEESRRLILEFLSETSGKGKPRELLERYVASEGLIDHILMMESAFPHYELDVEEIVAEADRVAVRMVFRGKHESEFQGLPATGVRATMPVTAFYHLADGRIVEAAVQADGATLVEQLMEAGA